MISPIGFKLVLMSSILCFICVLFLAFSHVLDGYSKLAQAGILAIPIFIMLMNSFVVYALILKKQKYMK